MDDVSLLVTWWFHDHSRWGLDFGPEVRLDMVAEGQGPPLPGQDPTDEIDRFAFSIVVAPQFGFSLGVRFAPGPGPLRRTAPRFPWGADRPDGTGLLARGQLGFRTGLLFGPGFNGTEGRWVTELWAAGSLRRRQGRQASFTPYHPGVLLGPFVRAQVGFLPSEPAQDRFLQLVDSITLIAGIRGQLRLRGPGPQLPEGP